MNTCVKGVKKRAASEVLREGTEDFLFLPLVHKFRRLCVHRLVNPEELG